MNEQDEKIVSGVEVVNEKEREEEVNREWEEEWEKEWVGDIRKPQINFCVEIEDIGALREMVEEHKRMTNNMEANLWNIEHSLSKINFKLN